MKKLKPVHVAHPFSWLRVRVNVNGTRDGPERARREEEEEEESLVERDYVSRSVQPLTRCVSCIEVFFARRINRAPLG